MDQLNELESRLFTFKMLLPCAPFPFETSVVAFNEKSAIKKGIEKAKQCGLKAWGPAEHIEKQNYISQGGSL